jgi:nucleoside-diphosphate-sugar epimerase
MSNTDTDEKRKLPKILVTGGTGLIGTAIQRHIDEVNPELGASARWMFVGSKP